MNSTINIILDVLSGGFVVVALVRLILIVSGKIDDVASKSKNWFTGFLLVSVSWIFLRIVFGLDIGGLHVEGKRNQIEIEETEESESEDNLIDTFKIDN